MKFALFQGCNIPARVGQYADATKAVVTMLDIELIEITEFNCCGYPARNIDFRAFVLSAARNLALAEQAKLDMMVMCKCCYGSLKKAGAHYICTACPYTHLQFDVVQIRLASNPQNGEPLAPILYPQLLGLYLGIDEKTLGMAANKIDLSDITSFLMTE